MEEELNKTQKNEIWELIPRPKDKSVIGTQWVFRNNLNKDRNVTKNKERLLFKGYAQVERIYFEKSFAPMAIMEEIKMFLAYA